MLTTLHADYLKEKVEDDIDLSFEKYQEVLESLKKRTGKYMFIKEAGYSFHKVLFNLFRIIWKREEIPESWRISTIIQLPKPKTQLGVLVGMRHIHGRNEYLKFLELIILSFIKENLKLS